MYKNLSFYALSSMYSFHIVTMKKSQLQMFYLQNRIARQKRPAPKKLALS